MERADPIAGDVRAAWRDGRERHGARKIKAAPERKGVTASSRRIGNIMRERGMRARTRADGPNRTGRGATRPGSRTCWTASSTVTPRARVWRAILPMSASAEAGRTCACWSAWRTGASPAIRRAGPGRGPGAGPARHARLPAGGRPRVPYRPWKRVRRHEDRRAARRVRHQRIAAAQG
ncbi:MAG: IS3 family transposase [Bifidobacterium breve]|nr:IS3 family transposase [Bifidobacterium breve]